MGALDWLGAGFRRLLVVELGAGYGRPLADVVHVAVVQLGAGHGRLLDLGALAVVALGAGYGRLLADVAGAGPGRLGARQLERTGRGR